TNPNIQDPCQRASELELELERGRVPTAEERALLEDHLRTCAACRLEQAAAQVLRYEPGEGPAPHMDELTRRRQISDAVSEALGGGGVAPGRDRHDRAGGPRRSLLRSWRLGALAAGLLLVVGLGAALLNLRGGSESHSPGGLGEGGRGMGTLMLLAGEARVDGARPLAGMALGRGQLLEVSKGRIALGLGDDARVLVQGGASLRLVELGPRGTELRLEVGEILVTVTPRRERSPFRVSTRAGVVEVKGTVFVVRVDRAEVSVRVARGQVQVSEPGRPPLAIGSGQAAQIGGDSWELRPLSPEEEAEDERGVASMDRLGALDGVEMSVQSRPSGARVELDGALIGLTPLVARVPAGHPLLRVSLEGRAAVQERITARVGERITRDYELGPVPVAAHAASSVPEAEPGRDGREAPHGVPGPSRQQTAASTSPVRPEPPEAQALLLEARQRRTARDWRGAVKAYSALLRHHGGSAEAPAARVALGLLLLEKKGDAHGALALFDAYLALTRRGPLAQEAAYGRVRALQRVGRKAEKRAALKDFLHYYPGALQEPLVKERLGSLERVDARSSAGAP
ncbi:MAG: FecR domain-containing protein, partial [Polyangia bacterium]|nr:FecR domain-containing protein [Polyangia bacterium]